MSLRIGLLALELLCAQSHKSLHLRAATKQTASLDPWEVALLTQTTQKEVADGPLALELHGQAPAAEGDEANATKVGGNSFLEERNRYLGLAFIGLPIAVFLVICFEIYHWRWSEVDWSLDQSERLEFVARVDNTVSGLTIGLFARAVDLTKLYFNGAGRMKGSAYIVMLLANNLFGKYLGLLNFDLQARIWNQFSEPNMDTFAMLMINWVLLITCMNITSVYSQYIHDMLMLHWREHMSRYFWNLWLPHAYEFKLKPGLTLDNPDQRIQEDVSKFVVITYSLTLGLWNSVTDFVIYGYMLWGISPKYIGSWYVPGWLLFATILYCGFGGAMTHWLAKDMPIFDFLTERFGGNFRGELRRVYQQSETVAAMRSYDVEHTRLQHRWDTFKLMSWRRMILSKHLNWFNHFYMPFDDLLSFCMLMPYFIQGLIDLGRVRQCQMARSHVSMAMNYFVTHYSGLAEFRAVVDRLHSLRTSAIRAASSKDSKNDGDGWDSKLRSRLAKDAIPPEWSKRFDCIERKDHAADNEPPGSSGHSVTSLGLKGTNVLLPSGEVLLRDVNISLPAGSCMLLVGREGAGKSTLLRALVGIWPFMDSGPGNQKDSSEDVVLIPQRPGLPSPMSVRDAATFPEQAGRFTDEEIITMLNAVGLEELVKAGLDTVMDVNSVLSGGQFQQLLVAHCLLAKPRWIFLDESMAHLSQAKQCAMYSLLRSELVDKCGTSIMSTSHEWHSLLKFHDTFYEILCGESADGLAERSVVPFTPKPSEEPEGSQSEVEGLKRRLAEKDAEIARLQTLLAAESDAAKQ